ncbi:major facilitator superfamily domain-containing protein 1-like isoform X2 [Cylas formicarius]|uniref:major facilitator superfamily domain-containing protein 1-like isoform X2 n=1 Tax=Cylas formicarius TaxID=197179 RepID=UPI0029587DC9|nr:major facilitator superfamily domain-containing protein 1-like isoform X2 [Cylas formicarius]
MEGGPNIQEQNVNDLSRVDETCCEKCRYSCCHPNGGFHRFIALIFMCTLGIGSYFCYDNPGALQEHMKQDLNITETQFTMLYSIYSWPNVILCFIGGFLIDRVFGIRLGTCIYMGLTLLGQIVFGLGAFWNTYLLMILGRLIFGIGAESLAVGQNNYAVLWFKGKELNMVFGIQMSVVRVGSAVGFEVMGYIYDWVHETVSGPPVLGYALLIAGLTCVFSMISTIILGLMDKRAEKILRRAETASNEVVRLSDVANFTGQFWVVAAICVTYYITIFPFISVGEEFFIKKFNMDDDEANKINSLVYWIASVISPLTGFLIDKTGRNVAWTFVAILWTIMAHVLLGFSSINAYIGVILMGLGYSTLASSLWPLVALIVPEYQLGTAYGICQSIQNLGLAVASIIVGQIVDKYGYTALEVFFTSSLILAFLFTLILWILDKERKGNLNLTPAGRKVLHERQMLNENLDRERLLDNEEQHGPEESATAQLH